MDRANEPGPCPPWRGKLNARGARARATGTGAIGGPACKREHLVMPAGPPPTPILSPGTVRGDRQARGLKASGLDGLGRPGALRAAPPIGLLAHAHHANSGTVIGTRRHVAGRVITRNRADPRMEHCCNGQCGQVPCPQLALKTHSRLSSHPCGRVRAGHTAIQATRETREKQRVVARTGTAQFS